MSCGKDEPYCDGYVPNKQIGVCTVIPSKCSGGPRSLSAPENHRCPKDQPVCAGYVPNKNWGHCTGAPNKCSTDHGSEKACCGWDAPQKRGWSLEGVQSGNPDFECTSTLPHCVGFDPNINKWGTCMSTNPQPTSAPVASQSSASVVGDPQAQNISETPSSSFSIRDNKTFIFVGACVFGIVVLIIGAILLSEKNGNKSDSKR